MSGITTLGYAAAGLALGAVAGAGAAMVLPKEPLNDGISREEGGYTVLAGVGLGTVGLGAGLLNMIMDGETMYRAPIFTASAGIAAALSYSLLN